MRQKVADPQTPKWMRASLRRIAQQSLLVEKLTPGTEQHQLATDVLLILQDSLHVMTEAKAIIADAHRCRERRDGR